MLISVIPIGNSKGIRLPKTILDQLQISDKLELEVENQKIVLKAVKNNTRIGWNDAFKKMHERNEDVILIENEIDLEAFEWEW